MPRIILNEKEGREERKVELFSELIIIVSILFFILILITSGIGYNIATGQTKAGNSNSQKERNGN